MTSLASRTPVRPTTPPPPDRRRWLPLPVMLTALFVITLDFFVVNVALPSMQADLHASTAAVQLWVAGYGVAFGALLIVGGRLGDRLGRRRAFVGGFALFTLASAACGLAPDPTSLVVARVAQGVGAALLSPQVLATIGVLYAGRDRTTAITAYGLTAGLGAVSGQLVGGALIQADVLDLGWRSCFLVNVPIGLAALAMVPRMMPESRATVRGVLDLPGAAFVTVGLAAIVLPLTEGRELGWPAWTLACLVGADVLLVGFVLRQRRLVRTGREPLVDPGLFAQRGFTAGVLATMAFQLTLASSFFVLALELQGGLGLDALDSGLVFTILAAGYLATSLAAPALAARLGRRRALTLGAAVYASGWADLALTAPDAGSAGALAPGLLVAGLGMGMLFAPLVDATLAGLPAARAGDGSGVVTTVQQVGNGIGVALLGLVFYGALDAGSPAQHAHAFAVSTWCLAGMAVLVGAVVRLLPAGRVAS